MFKYETEEDRLEAIRATKRRYKKRNLERRRQEAKNYRARNPERARAISRNSYHRRTTEETRKAAAARVKQWRIDNPEKARALRAAYRAAKHNATKRAWLSAVEKVYLECLAGFQVDHIVPLKHPLVCGLHVPWNMQYLTPAENASKHNNFDPDDPVQGNLAPRP